MRNTRTPGAAPIGRAATPELDRVLDARGDGFLPPRSPVVVLTASESEIVSSQLIIVPAFDGRIPARSLSALRELDASIDWNSFAGGAKYDGERSRVALANSGAGRTLAVVEISGERDEKAVRQAGLEVGLQAPPVEDAATTLPYEMSNPRSCVAAFLDGFLEGAYKFGRYRERGSIEAWPALRRLILFYPGADDEIERDVRSARVTAEALAWVRNLVNIAPNEATPGTVAAAAVAVARQVGLACEVWDESKIGAEGFVGLLAVSRGSTEPPYFVKIQHDFCAGAPTVVLVGKGVTFDSGGLCLKDRRGMSWMKCDMAGAAAVLGAIWASRQLSMQCNVVGLLPLTENMSGGSAMRPGDVIRHRNGLTTEITNTDAEGRLILADALCYAAELDGEAIIDVATLADGPLGEDYWIVLSNNERLASRLLESGVITGELGWQFPLHEPYRRHIRSRVADSANYSDDPAETVNAAMFLSQFVGQHSWAHIDTAYSAFQNWSQNTKEFAGATGSPTRTLVNFLKQYRTHGER
jgi:leucyl aminopeptidase